MRNAHTTLILGSIASLVVVSALLISGQSGHTQVPAKAKSVAVDLSKPFDHGSHLKLLRKKGDKLMACDDCHEQKVTAANKGFPICEEARMPFPSHNKCTGCHPKAFWTRPLQICTNCHLENTFTKQPPLKPQTTQNAPLRTNLIISCIFMILDASKSDSSLRKTARFVTTFPMAVRRSSFRDMLSAVIAIQKKMSNRILMIVLVVMRDRNGKRRQNLKSKNSATKIIC